MFYFGSINLMWVIFKGSQYKLLSRQYSNPSWLEDKALLQWVTQDLSLSSSSDFSLHSRAIFLSLSSGMRRTCPVSLYLLFVVIS